MSRLLCVWNQYALNWLRCLVANCSVDLLSDFSRNLAHVVRCPGVFLNLAKNFLITIAACDEIAVSMRNSLRRESVAQKSVKERLIEASLEHSAGSRS